jgi:hypothetical protein
MVTENAALQRKGMEIFHVFANSRWAILPPLFLAGGGIWAFPSGFPKPFWQCTVAAQQRLRAFLSGYWQKRGNFHPFPLKGGVAVNIS